MELSDWEEIKAHAHYILVTNCASYDNSLEEMLKRRERLYRLLEEIRVYPKSEQMVEIIEGEIETLSENYFSPRMKRALRLKKKGEMEEFSDLASEMIAALETYPHLLENQSFLLERLNHLYLGPEKENG